mmetsp:Transcript_1056/g.2822  ORF Transcript_1056/g.2822 Transcript_1056/m.2822 type:complete len:276 (+) Transcript_1056:377-1204(+)
MVLLGCPIIMHRSMDCEYQAFGGFCVMYYDPRLGACMSAAHNSHFLCFCVGCFFAVAIFAVGLTSKHRELNCTCALLGVFAFFNGAVHYVLGAILECRTPNMSQTVIYGFILLYSLVTFTAYGGWCYKFMGESPALSIALGIFAIFYDGTATFKDVFANDMDPRYIQLTYLFESGTHLMLAFLAAFRSQEFVEKFPDFRPLVSFELGLAMIFPCAAVLLEHGLHRSRCCNAANDGFGWYYKHGAHVLYDISIDMAFLVTAIITSKKLPKLPKKND